MHCASCGGPATDGHYSSWITGRRSQGTNLESPTSSTLVTTTMYYDFAPLELTICSDCFARSERLGRKRFWASFSLAAFGLLVPVFGVLFGSAQPLLVALAGGIAGGVGLLGIAGAVHYSPVYRLTGLDLEQHVLERFVRDFLRASGRDVFWTPEDFERMQRS